jgi:hypothetical protein
MELKNRVKEIQNLYNEMINEGDCAYIADRYYNKLCEALLLTIEKLDEANQGYVIADTKFILSRVKEILKDETK